MKNTVAKINFAALEAGLTEENREEYINAKRALRDYLAEAVPAVESLVSEAVGARLTVRESVQQIIEQIGRVDALAVVASLVVRHADDGRIYPDTVKWARRVPYVGELTIAAGWHLYTNRIHKAHLQQLAQAMREWEQEHPADVEPVEVEPVQAVEAAPVADPAPVAAEAAPAEVEPVKVARKARKPRKAAPVADPAPVVDEVEVAAATRIKEQDARRGEPQAKIPEGCTATVINGVIVAVSSCGDLTSNPAPVADAEPVKVARKARKPRKAAPVAAEAVEAAPVAEPVAVAAEPVEVAAADAEPVQVVEAEPVRSVAAAAAVVPVVESLSVPAVVDPATLSGWRFGADTVEVSGRVLPVSYSVTRSDEVYAFTALDGVAVRLHIGKGDELYTAALAAARGEAEARKAARMEPVKVAPVAAQAVTVDAEPVTAAEPVQVVEAVTVDAEPVAVAADPVEAVPAQAVTVDAEPVTAAEPVQVIEAVTVDAEPVEVAPAADPVEVVAAQAAPAVDPVAGVQGKSWAGSSIVGDGWRIVFDAVEERTRVFCTAPTDAQKAAIEGAGFWWSPRMGSWNKKLTCKAYRAAVALAEELRRIA